MLPLKLIFAHTSFGESLLNCLAMYGVNMLDKDFLMAGFSGVAFSSAERQKKNRSKQYETMIRREATFMLRTTVFIVYLDLSLARELTINKSSLIHSSFAHLIQYNLLTHLPEKYIA